jgi:nuclear receptor-binding protein
MSGRRSRNDPEHKSPRESGEDSEDESEILEESPCGRWLKRREEVSARYYINNNRLLFKWKKPNM